jgi:hypothetical protein
MVSNPEGIHLNPYALNCQPRRRKRPVIWYYRPYLVRGSNALETATVHVARIRATLDDDPGRVVRPETGYRTIHSQ